MHEMSLCEGILQVPQDQADAQAYSGVKAVEIRQRQQPCPRCASYQIQVIAVDQMRIRELEVV